MAATIAEPPLASVCSTASCDAPANTIVDNPTAAPVPKWSVTDVAPTTNPNGATPISIGATARAPSRTSTRNTPDHRSLPHPTRAWRLRTNLFADAEPDYRCRMPSASHELADRRVLITGAARGI